jgi:hypothetical protein
MQKSIRVYQNWEQEVNDSMSEWFWNQVGKAVIVGVAISVPMAAVGFVAAPEGVNRYNSAGDYIAKGHGAIWGMAGNALSAIAGAAEAAGQNGEGASFAGKKMCSFTHSSNPTKNVAPMPVTVTDTDGGFNMAWNDGFNMGYNVDGSTATDGNGAKWSFNSGLTLTNEAGSTVTCN